MRPKTQTEIEALLHPAPMVLGDPKWPAWAVVASLFATDQDTGIGDTIQREFGPAGSEPFKRFHEAMFGVWSQPCGCAGKIGNWNALYAYGEV